MTLERSLRLIAGVFRGRERVARDVRQPELPVVHAVRGTEPVPVGIYAVVSDDGDSSQGRRPGLKNPCIAATSFVS